APQAWIDLVGSRKEFGDVPIERPASTARTDRWRYWRPIWKDLLARQPPEPPLEGRLDRAVGLDHIPHGIAGERLLERVGRGGVGVLLTHHQVESEAVVELADEPVLLGGQAEGRDVRGPLEH